MRIYLLRHGIAEDAGPGTPDDKRELTDKGRTKLAGVLRLARRAAKADNARLELVLSSPLVRAVQTAEMAREILGVESPVEQTNVLLPAASPQKVWEELQGLRNLDEVLLAGHEPLLSSLAAWLLGAPKLQVHMTKAALLSIELAVFRGETHGILNWMVTPKLGE
jgi:phosphohistidine phosphatase